MFQNATRKLLNRFRKDRSGVAAMEFAMIAPMMLVLVFVSFEVTDTLAANTRAETAAASIADVVSRDLLVTDEESDDILAAVPLIVSPTAASNVKARITSVFVDADGRAKVVWSEGRGLAPLTAGAAFDLPTSLAVPNTGVVVGETTMTYATPLGLFFAGPYTFNKTEYRRSRILDPVLHE